jgi:hypothetical protein
VLAVQNLEAAGCFSKEREKDIEYSALEGSLSMMSKGIYVSVIIVVTSADMVAVLNDVLDLYDRLFRLCE